MRICEKCGYVCRPPVCTKCGMPTSRRVECVPAVVRDLVGTPWVEGGRDGSGIDCLGCVLVGLEALGIPAEDPWDRFARAWAGGWRKVEEAIPETWHRMHPDIIPVRGDLLVRDGNVAIMMPGGWVFGSVDGRGAFLVQLEKFGAIDSAWRFLLGDDKTLAHCIARGSDL